MNWLTDEGIRPVTSLLSSSALFLFFPGLSGKINKRQRRFNTNISRVGSCLGWHDTFRRDSASMFHQKYQNQLHQLKSIRHCWIAEQILTSILMNAGQSLVPKSTDEMATQSGPTEDNAAASAASAAGRFNSAQSAGGCSFHFGRWMQSQLISKTPLKIF